MVDNFIRNPRAPRASSVVNHRPDEAVLYAKRVISMSDLVQPRTTASSSPVAPAPVVPQLQPVTSTASISQQPRSMAPMQDIRPRPAQTVQVVHTDTITTTTSESGAYRSFEVDEVFVKIAAIESELPTSGKAALPDASGAATLARPAVPTDSLLKKFRGRTDWLRYGMAAVAAMFVLALTGYVSIDTWITNSEVKQVVAEKQESQSNGVILGEGEDETEVLPNAIDNYRVAGDLPRVLTIDKINVRARVLPMSVNADGAMQAPVNIFDSGWYGGSAKPGTPGATVIDAHASGATREGLFAYLDTLAVGDKISIERGDGQSFTYAVTHMETVALDDVDMDKLLTPYGNAKEGLNLITCTGDWLPDKKTYDHRVLVYTKRV